MTELLGEQWMRSSLVVLGLMLVRAALHPWLRPVWSYGICFLAALWLLVPLTPATPYSLWHWWTSDGTTWTVRTLEEPFLPPAPREFSAPANAPTSSAALPMVAPERVAPAKPISFSAIVSGLWIGGAALGLSVWAIRGFQMSRRLHRARSISDPRIIRLLAETRQFLRLRRHISIRALDEWNGPAICGLFWPTIVVRAGFLEGCSEAQVRMILLHELTHLKRGDVLTGLLLKIAWLLNWMNPLAWWIARRAALDRELATDALVVESLAAHERGDYGATLLHVARSGLRRNPGWLLSLIGMASKSQKNLQTRIETIMNSKIPHQSPVALALSSVAALALSVAVGFQPAQAAPEKNAGAVAELPAPEKHKQLRIHAQLFNLPNSEAAAFLSANPDGVVTPEELAALTAKGGLASMPAVITQSGQRAAVQSLKTFRYLAGYEAAGNEDKPKFEERQVGIGFEVEPVLGPDEKQMHINFAFSYGADPQVREVKVLAPVSKTPVPVEVPDFPEARIVTSMVLSSGETKIAGSSDAPNRAGYTAVLLLSAEVVF